MKIKEFVITSRSNPLITESIKLQKKRHRDESGRFLVDGRKLSYEYIKSCGAPKEIFVSENNSKAIIEELSEIERGCGQELSVTILSNDVFSKLTEQSAPDGIIIVGLKSALCLDSSSSFEGNERIIMLDSLQDPGNVGTLIRTALAFGFDRVVLSADSADVLNPKTLRASMGAAFSMRFSVVNSISEAVSALTSLGRRVYSAELRANSVSLDKLDVLSSDVFIIGNEGHGISREVSEKCFSSVHIPINEKSESLNAAIAGAVLMWHQHNSFD